MSEVGRLFEQGEYFVPEMLISARAMQEGLSVLKPAFGESKVRSTGKVVIGTVNGYLMTSARTRLHDAGMGLL